MRFYQLKFEQFIKDTFELPVPVTIQDRHGYAQTDFEMCALIAMFRYVRAESIFEFGTGSGATTMSLWRSLVPAEILTIDLPEPVEDLNESDLKAARNHHKQRTENPLPGVVGLKQLHGDTRHIDLSRHRVDAVFVDGGHHYLTVRADTNNALRMARKIIYWDDFLSYDVRKAIEELPIVWIPATRHAFYLVQENLPQKYLQLVEFPNVLSVGWQDKKIPELFKMTKLAGWADILQ